MPKSAGKQMSINIIASIVSFAVTVGINFFLTPYLVKEVGSDAYGFIGLANNFVQYATIVTTALNSISGRFISIAYHKGDVEKSSKIFSSVLVADLFLAAVMLILSSIFVCFLDTVLKIPSNLVSGVKITFAFAFLTFVVSTVTAIFTTAAFVKNRIDINSIRDIISNLIKVALIVLLFAIFPAQLYFVTLASFGSGIFLLLANITVKKKVLPEVKADIRKFDIKIVKTLLASGIWLSLAQLCQVLLSGLDLLICNLTLGTALMGLLSIAKTVPNSIGNLTVILGSVFTPHYTILYAKKKIPELIIEAKFSAKIVSFILSTPIAGFIAFGRQFYILWQPTKSPEEITMIQFMSVLTCITFLCSSQTQSLMMINTVCNKLRLPVFVNLTVGIVSVIVAIAACNLTDYGVYFVAGTSSVLMGLRALIFTPAYSAYILKQKLSIFFPTVIRDCVGFIIILVLFSIISNFITVTGWSSFIFICAICGILAYALSLPLLFNKAELCKLKNKLTKNEMELIMSNVEITVFTPSYNRAKTLPRVFECLKKQTYKSFEWIIIDDGSEDNTKDVVDGFLKEDNFFDIIYVYQNNQGKHIATNNAVKMCRGNFFITLDSDDTCTNDALETFVNEWNKIPKQEQKKYYGISCRTYDKDGKINGTQMNVPYIDSNDLDLRFKLNITGELWGMIRTDIMREFPFPVVEGYHFYPENVIWHNVGRKYICRYLSTALRYYIQDQENAVTNVNRKKASKEKFVMHLHYINDCWDYRKYNRKRYLEHIVAITRDGLANGYKLSEILTMLKTKPRRLLVLLTSPIGYLLYKHS